MTVDVRIVYAALAFIQLLFCLSDTMCKRAFNAGLSPVVVAVGRNVLALPVLVVVAAVAERVDRRADDDVGRGSCDSERGGDGDADDRDADDTGEDHTDDDDDDDDDDDHTDDADGDNDDNDDAAVDDNGGDGVRASSSRRRATAVPSARVLPAPCVPLRRFTPRQYARIATLGVLGITANQLLKIYGLRATPSIVAGLYGPLVPPLATVLAVALGRESFHWAKVGGMLLSLTGCALVVLAVDGDDDSSATATTTTTMATTTTTTTTTTPSTTAIERTVAASATDTILAAAAAAAAAAATTTTTSPAALVQRRDVADAADAAVVTLSSSSSPPLPSRWHRELIGHALLLANTSTYAAYLVLSSMLLADVPRSPLTVFVHVVAFGGGATLVLALVFARDDFATLRTTPVSASAPALLATSLLATSFGYVVNLYALLRTSATVVSAFVSLVPLAQAVLGVVVLGETLRARHCGGGLLILVGLAIVLRRKAIEEREQQQRQQQQQLQLQQQQHRPTRSRPARERQRERHKRRQLTSQLGVK